MALADVLAATVVRPVYAGWLDFKDDPTYAWNGPGVFMPSGTGDTDLDGNSFLPVAVASISDFVEDQGLGRPLQVMMAAGDMEDEEVFQQLVVDQRLFVGRRAKFWLLFLEDDESAVLPEFDVVFDGVIVGAEMSRQPGQPATITITCDQDLQKAYTLPAYWIDHATYNSGDTAASFLNSAGRGAGSIVTPGNGGRTNPSDPFDYPRRRPYR